MGIDWLALLVFVFIFGLLIFIHELGHFLAAKRANVLVSEFAFGFPPRIWAKKVGETEYALNLIPFGGYVKMLGEGEDPDASAKRNPRSYAHQPWQTRAKIILAGVTMNALLAYVIITLGLLFGWPGLMTPPAEVPLAIITPRVEIEAVEAASPGERLGLLVGDRLVKLDGQAITDRDSLIKQLQTKAGQAVEVQIERRGQTLVLSGELNSEPPVLGVALNDRTTYRLPFYWAPIYAPYETGRALSVLVVGIVQFLATIVSTQSIPEGAAGPVGIYVATKDYLEAGFWPLAAFTALLSANLAVLNILPIPALDGGHLLFIILERLNKGRRVLAHQIESVLHLVGFAFFLVLILAITYQDILKLLS